VSAANGRRPLPATAMERFARAVSRGASSSWAFGLAVMSVLIWAVLGPLLHFSDGWQLTINTATTIVTFLMVFLIQRSQEKDSQAVHLKLNEIVAALKGASNRLVQAEDLSEGELRTLRDEYRQLLRRMRAEHEQRGSHSVEELERTSSPPQAHRAKAPRDRTGKHESEA
jgi:low affinity Fe/Cu permease